MRCYLQQLMKSFCCLRSPPIGNRERHKDRQFDIDSFLEPLMEDLKTLAVEGVSAQRWVGEGRAQELQDFRLRAHLLTVSGDMPAIAKVWILNFGYVCKDQHKVLD
jgi:hypothetical protein